MFRGAVLSLTLTILASGVAWSQEPSTREEVDRQRREQQAKEVKPYEPNGLERALDLRRGQSDLHPRPRGLHRFRAPHAILVQGEYHWEIWSGFDAALFYDAGKVANRREDLNFENLESDYGIGFRFNTNSGVILRVDAAFGSPDGKHLYIVFGGVF